MTRPACDGPLPRVGLGRAIRGAIMLIPQHRVAAAVAMIGDIDRRRAQRYNWVIRSALAHATSGRVDVDCSHITTIDHYGVAMLLGVQLHAQDLRVQLRLRRLPPAMLRLLETAGATRLFQIV